MRARWPKTMAEIVNLKRIRKAKARDHAAREADVNRALHGTPKSARKLAKAKREKDDKTHDAHTLDPDDGN